MTRRRGGRWGMTPKKEPPPGMVWAFLGADEMPDGRIVKRYGWLNADYLHAMCKHRMNMFDQLPKWMRDKENGT